MDNLRGSLLMTLAMLGFAIEDVAIKVLSDRMPPGQIIMILGIGGALAFVGWFLIRREPPASRDLLRPKVLARTACEAFGTCFFVSSLALIPVTTASAVIQATPLVVALGGAVFLAQPVGWRRWTAILVGLFGVMLILRPGFAGFDPATLLAVLGMLGLASRDLLTRSLNSPVSSAHLSMAAFLSLVPTGLVLCWVTGTPLVGLDPADTGLILLAIAIGLVAYVSIVAATRSGDVAVISSFRYSRMVFALILGGIVFQERPDALTLIGAAIVIGAGLYALIREARLARASKSAQASL